MDEAARKDLLERVKRAILEVEPEATVLLYGSRARGDARENSDWDFLVLLDGEVDHPRRFRVRRHLYRTVELEAGEVLSTVFRERRQWEAGHWTPFRHNVMQEGVEL